MSVVVSVLHSVDNWVDSRVAATVELWVLQLADWKVWRQAAQWAYWMAVMLAASMGDLLVAMTVCYWVVQRVAHWAATSVM